MYIHVYTDTYKGVCNVIWNDCKKVIHFVYFDIYPVAETITCKVWIYDENKNTCIALLQTALNC